MNADIDMDSPETSEVVQKAAEHEAAREASRERQAGNILEQLNTITEWQENHQQEDRNNFEEIRSLIAMLPTKESISETIRDSVKTTVNGNIEDVKKHLAAQDVTQADFQSKLLPLDNTRVWLMRLVSGILYLGALAAALSAIVFLLYQLKIIK